MRRNISTRFHNISSPNHLIEIIDKETERMQRHYAGIQGFKISVDVPHSRHHRGNQVRAQVIVIVRHLRLVFSKEVEGQSEDQNSTVALCRAFDAAENGVERFFSRAKVRREAARFPVRLPTNDRKERWPATDGENAFV
jgi:ribosome-associated translation inhibitor RaiA